VFDCLAYGDAAHLEPLRGRAFEDQMVRTQASVRHARQPRALPRVLDSTRQPLRVAPRFIKTPAQVRDGLACSSRFRP
jgi:hypothetical protein